MACWGQMDSHSTQYVQSAGRAITGPSGPISTALVGHRSTHVPQRLQSSRLISGMAQSLSLIIETTAFL